MPILRGLAALFVVMVVTVGIIGALVLTRPAQTCSTDERPSPYGVIRTETCMIR
ncbi:hypothetical protein ACL02T_33010 [Pseudonocardia sp. RS010]|uniref:hypothetical protein n=1 Tax=Pseudonocardia sp. RS010 TaxID=3385979 RepID=UPI0039A0CA20